MSIRKTETDMSLATTPAWVLRGSKMTMKRARAIAFGGLKVDADEMRAAALKLRATKSSLHRAVCWRAAEQLEKLAAPN